MVLAAALALLAPSVGRAACTLSATGISFGQYNPSSTAPADFTGTVTITCSAGSGPGPYALALSIGGGGGYATRRMSGGGGFFAPYQLYADAAHSIVWGDGTAGTSTVPSIDNIANAGGTTGYTVFGRMLAGMAVNPLTYTDIIIATAAY